MKIIYFLVAGLYQDTLITCITEISKYYVSNKMIINEPSGAIKLIRNNNEMKYNTYLIYKGIFGETYGNSIITVTNASLIGSVINNSTSIKLEHKYDNWIRKLNP